MGVRGLGSGSGSGGMGLGFQVHALTFQVKV